MKTIRLKTEHLVDPVGVDFSAPRLFWNCEGGRKQTAYQIVAADDSGASVLDVVAMESLAKAGNAELSWAGGELHQH